MVYVIAGAATLLVLFVVFTYNGLIRKRNMVRNSFSSVDVNLMKRADLIPNLVETVKAYASHEKQTFESLTYLRSQIHQPMKPEKRLALEEEMRPALGRLMALAESYPQLKADSQFLNLQRNLTEVEEQISASRRAYNASVNDMNNTVQTIPTNIVAALFGFKQNHYFEAQEDKKEAVITRL